MTLGALTIIWLIGAFHDPSFLRYLLCKDRACKYMISGSVLSNAGRLVFTYRFFSCWIGPEKAAVFFSKFFQNFFIFSTGCGNC
jgi:hypothetical protein